MTSLLITAFILQSFSISLGVGASTLAITNFFVAISDGKIDESERKMMGIVYVVLRIAMVLILLSTAALAYIASGDTLPLEKLFAAEFTIVAVLFINAILMTARLMPSKFGPSIQAGSWYTFGALLPLTALGLATFSYTAFLIGYITFLVLVTLLVNGIMRYQRRGKN